MMKDNPGVNPQVTIACGSSSVRKLKTESDTDEDNPDNPEGNNFSNVRIGKSRIPKLKRPQSKSDKKCDALYAVAAAINRRNDFYEDYFTSKAKQV